MPQRAGLRWQAEGFGLEKGHVTLASARRALDSLGAIQIDSVNVLVRSQYLPLFSRFGPYDRAVLDRLSYGKPRRAFEYWGHEASLLPIELFSAMRPRMEGSAKGIGIWKSVARVGREQPALVHRILETFRERGPMCASEFEGAKVRATGGDGPTSNRPCSSCIRAGRLRRYAGGQLSNESTI